MRVVIAPDKFKGTLTAVQAAEAIERGFRSAVPDDEYVACPMADGGEGTVDVFVAGGAQRRTARVRGPLGDPVEAAYAVQDDTAIVEMSAASGLGLLDPAHYDPVRATTYGTGELLRAALDAGATHIIVGIGGSATNDAGTGMLRALGVRFLRADESEIDGATTQYETLERIDLSGLDPRLAATSISAASDVDNPLTGPNGAAHTFAEQKGADEDQIDALDRALARIADVAAKTLGKDLRDEKGAGAAGGLGFALLAFLHAKLEPGVDLIARERGLPDLLHGAQLCATGEGKIDEQTLHGKTVFGVGRIAKRAGASVVAFGGSVDSHAAEELRALGIETRAIDPDDVDLETALREAAAFLERAAAEFRRTAKE